MKKHSTVMMIMAAASLILASCSSVFTSTITGKVVEKNGTQEVTVDDVDVYAFLSESERDAAVSAQDKPETTVRIFHAITDTNGSYSMPVEWNTSHPTFGKTADRIPVYLAFYHVDFNSRKLSAAKDVSYLSSERTNTMETETLKRTSDTYTLNLTRIYDVSGTNYSISPTNFTVTVKDSGGDTLYEGTPTGTSVSFSASTASDSVLSGTVSFVPNNQDEYIQCTADGDIDSSSASFTLATKNATNPAEPVYMKHLVLSEMTLEGYYTLDGNSSFDQNGLAVNLYKGSDATTGTLVSTTTTAIYYPSSTQTMHGHFMFTIPSEPIDEDDFTGTLYTEDYYLEVLDPEATTKKGAQTIERTSDPLQSSTLIVTLRGSST